MREYSKRAVPLIVALLLLAPSAQAKGAPGGGRLGQSAQATYQTQLAAANQLRKRQDASALTSEAARRKAEEQRGIPYSYTDLTFDMARHQVAFASFAPASAQVQIELRDGEQYTIGYPPGAEQQLAKQLTDAGASVTFTQSSSSGAGSSLLMGPLIVMLVLTGVIGLLWLLRKTGVMKPGAGGGMMGQHPFQRQQQQQQAASTIPDVTFADVAGCDEAVEEVKEMVTFLKAPERFHRLGAKMPSGVLLYGPPGTGKTLLAKALANAAGVPFFATSGSDFVEIFVGVGASRIRTLFEQAKKSELGAVVFIDELDAVGAKRSSGESNPGAREDDKTLNALLSEMDGFNGRQRIVVIAATNRLDTLDPALLRPGRFSRHIQVSTPDRQGRLAILKVHSQDKPLAEDADLERLAHITATNSGAELAEMVNEAAIMAAREEHDAITNEDLWEGLCRVIAGPKKRGSVLAEGEREVVAYHEAGHVLAGELCPTQDKTQHATIEARGQALGFALKGQTDRAMHNEQFLHEQLIFILGGRAAEYVTYGTVSSGAANDLQQANLIARQAVEQWGLSPRVGQIINQDGGFKHLLSEQTRAVIDEEVCRLVADAYRDSVALISEHERQLKVIATALLGSGNIDRPEIELAMEGVVVSPRRPLLSHSPDPAPVLGAEERAGKVIDGRELFGARRRAVGRLAATVRVALTRGRRERA